MSTDDYLKFDGRFSEPPYDDNKDKRIAKLQAENERLREENALLLANADADAMRLSIANMHLDRENERLRNEIDSWRKNCREIRSTAERLWGEDWDVDLSAMEGE